MFSKVALPVALAAGLMAGGAVAHAAELRLNDAQLDSLTAGNDFPEFSGGIGSISFGEDLDFTPIGPTFGDFTVFPGPLNPPLPEPEPEPVPNDPRSLISIIRDQLLGQFGGRR